ncbi:PEP-CTERM sorting domain-containing protein [Pseudoduganella lutea]|nr:PEP-CTERM sorting domain-containing protein [Pseudoduganella lutea]
MKKTLCILAAGLAFGSTAHATQYTLQYTATIGTISDGGFPEQFFSSATANGNLIVIGDTVTGRFTFDSEQVPVLESDYGLAAEAQYGYNAATTSFVQFDKTGYSQVSNTGSSYIRVTDSRDPAYSPDSVHLVGYTYSYNPVFSSAVSLSLQAPSADTLDGTALPSSEFASLAGTFQYSYGYFTTGGYQSLLFRGDITSLSVVSSVPEPGTYAMLLAGLGIVCWRRRAAKLK